MSGAVHPFETIRENFRAGSKMLYDDAIRALKLAYETYSKEDTKDFLDSSLYGVVELVTDQTSVHQSSARFIDECIHRATEILLLSFNSEPLRYLNTLTVLLDKMRVYYYGQRSAYWNAQSPHGSHQVRTKMIEVIAKDNGFEKVLAAMEATNTETGPRVWLSVRGLLVLFLAIIESRVSVQVKSRCVNFCMKALTEATDDQLKNEPADVVQDMLAAFCAWTNRSSRVSENFDASVPFRAAWLRFTQRLLASNTLVLKLLGLNQAKDLSLECKKGSPAGSYMVCHAGTEHVNGLYVGVAGKDAPTYVKEGTDGKPTMTIYRWDMSDPKGCKWWFLGEKETDVPTESKEYDYYQHKSTHVDWAEPPMRNWEPVGHSMSAKGVLPAPTLLRMGNLNGSDNQATFAAFVKGWAGKHKVLESVLGSSLHREVVVRSTDLVILLAECNSLAEADVRLMWKAGFSESDPYIMEEVFNLLGVVSSYLSKELYATLLDLASQEVRRADRPTLDKVGLFLSKIVDVTESSAEVLMNVVCDVFSHPYYDSMSSGRNVEHLLTQCLQCSHNRTQLTIDYIRKFAGQLDQKKGPLRETDASRMVDILQYFIAEHTDQEVTTALHEQDFASFINQELMRYVRHGRSLLDGLPSSATLEEVEVKTVAVCTQIRKRLKLLRFYYGKSSLVDMTYSGLRDLWLFLVFTHERNEYLRFLAEAAPSQHFQTGATTGQVVNTLAPAYSEADCQSVFKNILCDPEVDWSGLQEDSFACLETYFQRMCGGSLGSYPYTSFSVRSAEEMAVAAELETAGIDMLWRVAIKCTSADIVRQAMRAIVAHCKEAYRYKSALDESSSPLPPLISRISDELRACTQQLKSGEGSVLSAAQLTSVERCAKFLLMVIAQSEPSAHPPHVTRGNMSRIKVTVTWRKQTTANSSSRSRYYGSGSVASQYDAPFSTFNTPYVEGTAELEVHPMQRIRDLKQQLATEIDYKNPKLIQLDIERGRPHFSDNDFICDQNINQGAQLCATISALKNTREDELMRFCAADFLQQDSTLFDTLMDLSTQLRQSAPLCARYLWNLLVSIPTSEALLDSVRSDDCLAVIEAGDGSVARTVYMLHTMAFLLEAGAGDKTPEESNGDVDHGDSTSYQKSCLVFREHFLSSNGMAAALNFLLSLPDGSDERKDEFVCAGEAVTLHIMHSLLTVLHTSDGLNGVYAVVNRERSMDLLNRLLKTQVPTGTDSDTEWIFDAFSILKIFLSDTNVADMVVKSAYARILVVNVLTCSFEKVRAVGLEFVCELGRHSASVLDWLLDNLEQIDVSSLDSDEFILAISELSTLDSHGSRDAQLKRLVQIVADVLAKFPATEDHGGDGQVALGALLRILAQLINVAAPLVQATKFGDNIVHNLLSRFLLTVPTDQGSTAGPLCRSPTARDAAFEALLGLAQKSADARHHATQYIQGVVSKLRRADTQVATVGPGQEGRRSENEYAGLKNQGCTCYMNSTLQQLFLIKAFREAILSVELPVRLRTMLWHVSNDDLIGATLWLEWEDESWRQAEVLEVTAGGDHVVEYAAVNELGDEVDGERVVFNVRLGREGMETGRAKWFNPDNDYDDSADESNEEDENGDVKKPKKEKMSDKEVGALYVLEQLQRTFYFMMHGQGRYFDPRPLVDACKVLTTMAYNVYQQNDASEFWQGLMDSIELATNGKFNSKNLWEEVIQKEIFGGGWYNQKIPKDCESYNTDKTTCGHWQTSKKEMFLNLMIEMRGGADEVADALANQCKGEMMEGDNAVECDVCKTKKDTNRRTCIGELPNVLMIHFKRFDLDFQTFQTVKINGRMAFPRRLNMYPYTRKGVEAADRAREQEAAAGMGMSPGKSPTPIGKSLRYEDEDKAAPDSAAESEGVDLEDYAYELQGVLVHSGVAQGGHYYSYARGDGSDDGGEGEWFCFDDEDVTAFDASELEAQCFGGPQASSHSGKMIEGDRSRNALMTFYSKVKRGSPNMASSTAPSSPVGSVPGSSPTSPVAVQGGAESILNRLVDGCEAFEREVQESNLRHIVLSHLCDPCLHKFLAQVLMHLEPERLGADDAAADEIFTSSTSFFLEYILRFNRDIGVHSLWLKALQRLLSGSLSASRWLVQAAHDSGRLKDATFAPHTEPLSKQSFNQVFLYACHKVAPQDPTALLKLQNEYQNATQEQRQELGRDPVFIVLWTLYALVTAARTAADGKHRLVLEDMLSLTRDLCAVECARVFVLDNLEIYRNLVVGSDGSTSYDDGHGVPPRYFKPDRFVMQAALEVVAVAIGIPHNHRVPLIDEHTKCLTPKAAGALTQIFAEYQTQGSIEMKTLLQYITKSRHTKANVVTVRAQFSRYGMKRDDCLPFVGFIQFYTDLALVDSNQVWRDLYSHDFDNDLSRGGGSGAAVETGASAAEVQPALLTDDAARVLTDLVFYTEAMVDCQQLAMRILQAVYQNNARDAYKIGQEALKSLYTETQAEENSLGIYVTEPLLVLRHLLRVRLQSQARLIELLVGDGNEASLACKHYEFRSAPRPQAPSAGGYGRREPNYRRADKLVEYARIMCEVPEVYEWLAHEDQADKPLVQALLTRLQVPCASVYLQPFSTDALKRSCVVVEGAEDPEANGLYSIFTLTDDQQGRKHPGYGKRIVGPAGSTDYRTIMVHRCRLKDGKHRWYISEIPKGSKPGEVSDIDKYETLSWYNPDLSVPSLTNDWTPPRRGWNAVGKGTVPSALSVTWSPRRSGEDGDVDVSLDDDNNGDDDDESSSSNDDVGGGGPDESALDSDTSSGAISGVSSTDGHNSDSPATDIDPSDLGLEGEFSDLGLQGEYTLE